MIGSPAERPRPLFDDKRNLIALARKPHVRLAHGHLGSPCWVAQRARGGDCRGYLYARLVSGHTIVAHRWIWAARNRREIPPGMVVHHECYRPNCLNPQHLALVSFGENSRLSNYAVRKAVA